VTDELASRLSAWAAEYDSHLNRENRQRRIGRPQRKIEFDRSGRALCRELAREIGGRYDIFYSSRCIPVSALNEPQA